MYHDTRFEKHYFNLLNKQRNIKIIKKLQNFLLKNKKSRRKNCYVKLGPGEGECRAPKNTSEYAECSNGWKPWAKLSTKDIL